jgi:hypothetical protein
MLSMRGIILLLLVLLYPRKLLACEKAIIIAEADVNPELLEWLMKWTSHPSLYPFEPNSPEYQF